MSPARGASIVCEKSRVLASQWRDIRALTMNDASAARHEAWSIGACPTPLQGPWPWQRSCESVTVSGAVKYRGPLDRPSNIERGT
jgi:hypothetical protein